MTLQILFTSVVQCFLLISFHPSLSAYLSKLCVCMCLCLCNALSFIIFCLIQIKCASQHFAMAHDHLIPIIHGLSDLFFLACWMATLDA